MDLEKSKELTEKITETAEYKEHLEVVKNIKKIVNKLLGKESSK